MRPERVLIAEPVSRALAAHRGVVALETTVVTHGLPHPKGLEVAHAMEARVLAAGAEPATIGVLDGRMRVGLTREELERLAGTSDVPKLNLSNLAATLAAGGSGSTTVAATMLAAHHAGIGVFATGGIGGVHRGAEQTDDVSADLTALARLPVVVVCAGAKSILDLSRTVERLETYGVPVYGYRCDEFPAFWRRSSGLKLDRRFDELQPLASAIREHHALGTGTGVIVANPVPEAAEMDERTYDRAMERALARVQKQGIRGRGVTPAILEAIQEATGGKATSSNIALLEHNATVAAGLAVTLAAAQ
ncbi:MAG TPA: pseudouridine-5'-phosphate glycosidase [Methylomirabilota bacterium]|nr:pseudouridine-5'-phosphate glycosidase [Methylomirabilota bacterium]